MYLLRNLYKKFIILDTPDLTVLILREHGTYAQRDRKMATAPNKSRHNNAAILIPHRGSVTESDKLITVN